MTQKQRKNTSSKTKKSVKKKQDELSPQDAMMLQGNHSFVPFVVALLERKSMHLSTHTLPCGKPEFLTKEAARALQEIVKRATLGFLCRENGWRKLSFAPLEGGQLYAEHPSKGPVWNQQVWKETKLSYSHNCINLLLAVYNLTRTPKYPNPQKSNSAKSKNNDQRNIELLKIQDKNNKKASERILSEFKPETNGDMLFHHLVFRRLLQNNQMRFIGAQNFVQNPINMMHSFWLFSPFTDKQLKALDDLLKPEMVSFLPWLSVNWKSSWCKYENARPYQSLQGFRNVVINQGQLFHAWMSLLVYEERSDLLEPFLGYYRHLFENEALVDKAVVFLREQTQPLRMVETQKYFDQWLHTLTPALQVRKLYVEAQELHPIDREAQHHILMSSYANIRFDKTVKEFEQLRRTLQPTL